MPRIVIERGNEKGLGLNLEGAEVNAVVGRLKTSALVLTDGLASRQHFRIFRKDDRYFIADLDSHNGTYVNGERITAETELHPGATIRAGETLFSFQTGFQNTEGALSGTTIGGYHLLARLGVGGMGEVYKATQLSLRRVVALKILSPELTQDRAFVEKFFREARAAGKLNHPNVVQVHEAGEDHGTYYFSMECAEGGSVQDLVAKGRRLEPRRATEIVLQAAHALEYAEKFGIVHCDIKPDNLMLTASGEVRLADLGIAKSLNAKGKAEQAEGVFGSPHYMSPEQAQGLPLDRRSDLYSLGATYYRILLGKVPFTGKDAREIMEKQVYDAPEPARRIDPELAPTIYVILGRLLKKRPAERYQSASRLIADLQTALREIDKGTKLPATQRHPAEPPKSRLGRFFGY